MKEILGVIAPTIATVLGGPLAGLAVEALGGVFGLSEPTKEKVTEALQTSQMNAEIVAAIKKVELDFKIRLKELDIKVEELKIEEKKEEVKDRMSARTLLQMGAGKLISWVSILTITAFFGLVFAILRWKVLQGMDAEELVIVGTIIGYLAAYTQQVYNFLFGSSAGSDKKNEGLMAAIQKLGNGNGNHSNGTQSPPSG
jgi:hypothetical protein